MNWTHVLTLMARACAEQGEERHVELVLGDGRHHVKEPLSLEAPADGVLGFVVYADDPSLSQRSPATRLLFVPPSQVLRVVVQGEASSVPSSGFGFATP